MHDFLASVSSMSCDGSGAMLEQAKPQLLGLLGWRSALVWPDSNRIPFRNNAGQIDHSEFVKLLQMFDFCSDLDNFSLNHAGSIVKLGVDACNRELTVVDLRISLPSALTRL